MSRHTFYTTVPVEVTMGYDRSLDCIRCFVFRGDTAVYSSLDDPNAGTECRDVEYFRRVLAGMQIFLPESVYIQTKLDHSNQVGNRSTQHSMDGTWWGVA